MADDGAAEPEETNAETPPKDLWERLREHELSVPDPDPTPTGGSTTSQVIIGEPEDTPAIRQLRAWVARRTRTQVAALVLASLLAFGPFLAVFLILRADSGPISELISPESRDPSVTLVTATIVGLSPNQGEVRTRLAIEPAPDSVDENGRLTDAVSVVVNGTITELRAGDTVRPFEVTLAMSDGSITRYPFDAYHGQLVVYLTTGAGDDRTTIPHQAQVRSVVGDFTLSADLRNDPAPGNQPLGVIDWRAERPPTTTVYAIWLMVLMWALAVTGLLIVWVVIIWMVEIPMWVFGYFVGVLFALPPLRDSLPGRPPPGNLFDFLSFYWSVTIIGVSLILSLTTWLTRARAEQRLRALDTSSQQIVD